MELGVGKIASREVLKPAAQLCKQLECWNKLILIYLGLVIHCAGTEQLIDSSILAFAFCFSFLKICL